MIYKIRQFTNYHLIRSEDLNHHGSIFAGRASELFVESGFIAAAHLIEPKNLVCVKIDSLTFNSPARLGEILCFNSRIIRTGKSSLTAYVRVNSRNCDEILVDGFATFVNVDENTKSQPHHIELEISCDEDLQILKKLNTNNGR